MRRRRKGKAIRSTFPMEGWKLMFWARKEVLVDSHKRLVELPKSNDLPGPQKLFLEFLWR
jgi:hypothetical protein